MRRLIAAGAERFGASASEDDDTDGSVPTRAVECIDQLIAGQAAKGIVLLRSVDRDRGNAILFVIEQIGVGFSVCQRRLLIRRIPSQIERWRWASKAFGDFLPPFKLLDHLLIDLILSV